MSHCLNRSALVSGFGLEAVAQISLETLARFEAARGRVVGVGEGASRGSNVHITAAIAARARPARAASPVSVHPTQLTSIQITSGSKDQSTRRGRATPPKKH